MPRARILPLAAVLVFSGAAALPAAPDVAALRAQLALATADEETLSRIELLRRIVDADPADTASHRLLIELWREIGDYDLAEATLDAWPAAPADLVALTRAAILRQRDRDVPGAIRVLRAYLATAPEDLPAHEALVSALLTTDDARAQLAALDALIALAPRNPGSLIQRAGAKFRLADYPGALADAKAAQALDPDSTIVKDSLPAFDRLEETLAALPPLDAALAKDPRDLAKLVERAWWLRYGGLLDRSLADADAALGLAPDSLAAKVSRTRVRFLLGKTTAEAALRDDLIDAGRPNTLEATLALAAADRALAAAPHEPALLRQRARALNAVEQFRLAQREAGIVLNLTPVSKETAAAGLEALYATALLGQDPAPLFRRVEALRPPPAQLAVANAHLADFYFRQSNLPLALEFADRSLALDETEFMLRVKAATLKRLGRTADAEPVTQRAEILAKRSKK